ncbi:hypothetical protein BLNAU_8617 [Blattamonas nauphoetae]|uniref:CSC1/OSCA1-like cytosolic domain-containing protein n=1 Tax=Blattamonas nauphoetae TaxID=2049346 RepID=A0ABQ9XY46_9EUKA|nr:hypothetical protein BLNAU_8617 [Blattamonas nauphoetae]
MPDRAKLKKAKKFSKNFILQNQIPPGQSRPLSFCEHFNTNVHKMGLSTGASSYFYIVKTLAIIFSILSLFSLGIVACCVLLNLNTPKDLVSAILMTTLDSVIKAHYAGNVNLLYYFLIVGLQFAFTLVLYISLLLLKRKTEKLKDDVDSRTLSTGDYSVMVKKLPAGLKDAKILARHFEQWGKVHSVILCYDVRDFGKIQIQLDDAVTKYTYSRLRHHATPELMKRFTQTYLCEEDRIVDTSLFEHEKHTGWHKLLRTLRYRQDIDTHSMTISRNLEQRSTLSSPVYRPSPGIAFVTFVHSVDAVSCAKDYQFNLNRLCCSGDTDDALIFSGKVIDVIPKVEPTDVIFQNIGYSHASRACRQILMVFVSLIFVSFSVGLMLLIKSFTLSSIVSLLLSMAISLLSSLLSFFIRSLSPFTHPLTRTESVTRSIFRIWLSDFLFQIFGHYVISIFHSQTTYDAETYPFPSTFYFFSPAWFTSTAFSLFLNAVVDYALILFFESTHIFDRLPRLPFRLKSKKVSQTELNFVRAPPSWPLERRFAHVIKTTMTISLLSPFFPALTPICALFLFIIFLVDKANVISYYQIPPQYGFGMINQGLSHLGYAFHLNAISTIVTSLFSMWTNKMEQTSPLYLIPFILHSVLYGVILLISIIKWIYKRTKDGCGGEHDNAKDDDFDETQGLPFDIFETKLQCFHESHPLYVDEKTRKKALDLEEAGQTNIVVEELNADSDEDDSDINESSTNSPRDEEEMISLTRLLSNITPMEGMEPRQVGVMAQEKKSNSFVNTSPLPSYMYYSLYSRNPPKPRSFKRKDDAIQFATPEHLQIYIEQLLSTLEAESGYPSLNPSPISFMQEKTKIQRVVPTRVVTGDDSDSDSDQETEANRSRGNIRNNGTNVQAQYSNDDQILHLSPQNASQHRSPSHSPPFRTTNGTSPSHTTPTLSPTQISPRGSNSTIIRIPSPQNQSPTQQQVISIPWTVQGAQPTQILPIPNSLSAAPNSGVTAASKVLKPSPQIGRHKSDNYPSRGLPWGDYEELSSEDESEDDWTHQTQQGASKRSSLQTSPTRHPQNTFPNQNQPKPKAIGPIATILPGFGTVDLNGPPTPIGTNGQKGQIGVKGFPAMKQEEIDEEEEGEETEEEQEVEVKRRETREEDEQTEDDEQVEGDVDSEEQEEDAQSVRQEQEEDKPLTRLQHSNVINEINDNSDEKEESEQEQHESQNEEDSDEKEDEQKEDESESDHGDDEMEKDGEEGVFDSESSGEGEEDEENEGKEREDEAGIEWGHAESSDEQDEWSEAESDGS